jgi:V8-like Glu-specific endopeptidase
MSGEITEDGKLFQYDMDTGYGMSGAPIIEKV